MRSDQHYKDARSDNTIHNEELWQTFFKDESVSVHISEWPKANASLVDKDAEESVDMAVAIIAAIRQYKNKRGLALNAPLDLVSIECEVTLRKKLERTFEDIKGTIKTKDVEFGQGDLEIEGFPIKIGVRLPSNI
jgi:valyl-tRNA synthetase